MAKTPYDWTGGIGEMASGTPGSAGWWMDRLTRRLIARSTGDMVRYAAYYAGDHYGHQRGANFIGERLAFLLGPQFRNIRVNYSQIVVDKLVERLEVTGFRDATATDADSRLWGIWQDNGLDQEFTKGLREGAIKGEFSLALWEANGKPQLRVQDPLHVVIATDPEDRRIRRAALKRWFDEDMGLWYATLYMPNQIWKFQAASAPTAPDMQVWWEQDYWGRLNPWLTWQPRVMPGDEPFTFANPFADVPIVSFPNKPDLAGVGVSELRDILPIQDKINKLNYDLLMASEYAAFPQKWAVNVPLEPDANGKITPPWQIGVDRMFIAGPPESGGDAETKFGQFEAAQLNNWLDALDGALRELAVVASLPGHYLPGRGGLIPPSGEALRAAESGLTRKAIDRQRDHAEPLEIAMRFAAKIAGETDIANAQNLETLWRDPEVRTESEHLNALVLMAGLGVPRKALWARIPATPTEIEQWEALLEKGDVVPINTKLLEKGDVAASPQEALVPGATTALPAAAGKPVDGQAA